jgi:Wax ester synthase-like Acyl-CoA acyltransferase domain/WS/DGAT C-terminal domain
MPNRSSSNTPSQPGSPKVEWDDQIWLKISVPGHEFVSSGVLFFRGRHDAEQVRREIGRALRDYPKLLGAPKVGEDGALRWAVDPAFDPLEHVKVQPVAAAVRVVGGRVQMAPEVDRALREIVDTVLPKDRPLWRVVILTDLEFDGEPAFCLVLVTHHSVADGVAYYDMLANICQHAERGKHYVREEPVTRAGWPRRVLERAKYLLQVLWPEPQSAVRRGAPGELRLAISAAHSTAKLAAFAKRARISMNALALAALARALGSYASAAPGGAPRWIRAVLPVSMHTRSEDTRELVNRMGYFYVKLALHEEDVVTLARDIDAQLKSFKIFGIDGLMRWFARTATALPTALTRVAHRFFSSRSSIVVSCFPFPSGALTLGGAEAVNLGAFPVIPRPLSLSSMVVTHARTITLYLRSAGIAHDVEGMVARFGEVLTALGEEAAEAAAGAAPLAPPAEAAPPSIAAVTPAGPPLPAASTPEHEERACNV